MSPPRVGGLAVLLVALAAGCGNQTDDVRSAPPASPADRGSPTAPTTPPTPSPTPTRSTGRVAVPVYFIGSTPRGPRLYSELRTVDDQDAVDQALVELAEGPHDPDYTSYLRPGQLRLESYDETAVLVVPDSRWAARRDGLSDRQAQLALQQVVLTVQAALGKRIPIGFRAADGDRVGDFFGLTAPADSNGYPAAEPLDVLALVNVTAPVEGQRVSRSFTASGLASSFEGTVGWRLLDSSGQTVRRYSTTTRGDYTVGLVPWTTTVRVGGLAPGDYTFVASTDSGAVGYVPDRDTKSITVS